LEREAKARAAFEQWRRERMPHLVNLSPEELRQHLLQKLEAKKKAEQAPKGNHDTL
jgi:hypothetical protein